MQYAIIPVTPYQQNCSLIICEKTQQAAFVDPGGDLDILIAAKEELGVEIEKILLTHGHVDHAGESAALAEYLSVPIIGPHRDDLFLLQDLHKQGARLGLQKARALEPDQWLEDGEQVSVGKQKLNVIHCPGHTPGHVVFYNKEINTAFVGDVLFQGSIGRTDFPRGNHQALLDSIRNNLWPLGNDVSFVPGHGPMSTFGLEREHNPFVADALFRVVE